MLAADLVLHGVPNLLGVTLYLKGNNEVENEVGVALADYGAKISNPSLRAAAKTAWIKKTLGT